MTGFNTTMRYNLFFFALLFGISILSSCVNTDITAEEPTAIVPKVSPVHAIQPKALLPGGSLFTALTEGGRDTILSKIRRIENQQKRKNPIFTAQIKRDFHYFPIVEEFSENGKTYYRPSKDVVCVDETIPTYYIAYYHDRSNFKKEDNLFMYNGVKEVLGQEFADDMVRRYKANKWTISYSYTGGGLNDDIDYAIKESDDGSFFLLKHISPPYGRSINACYFKDGKPYICKKDDDGSIIGKELQ